jgi:hypothetical protein
MAALIFFVVFSVPGEFVNNFEIGSDHFLSNVLKLIFQEPSTPPVDDRTVEGRRCSENVLLITYLGLLRTLFTTETLI